MIDHKHKINRAIVNEAIDQDISTIKLETLAGIRSTSRTCLKNNHSLHNRGFYHLTPIDCKHAWQASRSSMLIPNTQAKPALSVMNATRSMDETTAAPIVNTAHTEIALAPRNLLCSLRCVAMAHLRAELYVLPYNGVLVHS